MPQPYKMYRFKCSDGHSTHKWTDNEHKSYCPKCNKYCQNYGKYTPYE